MTQVQTESTPKLTEDPNHKRCHRCIMDSSIPGIHFDKAGECNFCKVHDNLDKQFSLNGKAQTQLKKMLTKIKAQGRGKKYDCVMGVSGGRDSTYSLYMAVKEWGLRPLAVHFNDGFGNPMAGENMMRVVKTLGVDLRTVTSDWRESKDLKIAFLKSSTPDMEEGTDLGIGAALYGLAAKEKIKTILIGQSFRTEGICPLSWNYLDGKYLKAVHKQFGSIPLRPWTANDPGFNLDMKHMFYYSIIRGIRAIPILYYMDYVRKDVDAIIKKEVGWQYPGAHYYDDLYQSFMTYVYRIKFKIERRLFNYSALVRSGQMDRDEALKSIEEIYTIEDPKVIQLCIKRLGITQEQFESYLAMKPKTFHDYPNQYKLIKRLRLPIKIAAKLNLIPPTAYDKYFNCGI